MAIASIMGRPTGIRKARTALSVSDKKKVLDELKAGKPTVDVAAEFQIRQRQVSNIRKHSDAVVKCITRRDTPIHSILTSNKAKHPNIDMAVFEWFHLIRVLQGCRKPLPVSRALIKSRALYVAKQQCIRNFLASDGWFSHWRWRFSVTKSVRLHGEAGEGT